MSERHTPGEWRYDKGFIKAGEPVKLSTGIIETIICSLHGTYGPHIEGNARLISAAPDLLRELQKVLACIEANGQCLGDMDAIRAAIAKANPDL